MAALSASLLRNGLREGALSVALENVRPALLAAMADDGAAERARASVKVVRKSAWYERAALRGAAKTALEMVKVLEPATLMAPGCAEAQQLEDWVSELQARRVAGFKGLFFFWGFGPARAR